MAPGAAPALAAGSRLRNGAGRGRAASLRQRVELRQDSPRYLGGSRPARTGRAMVRVSDTRGASASKACSAASRPSRLAARSPSRAALSAIPLAAHSRSVIELASFAACAYAAPASAG